MPVTMSATLSTLHHLAAILVAGPDASEFLQGQLSNDIRLLTAGRCQLAACSSPQGRVQAVVTLVPTREGILLLLPSALVSMMLARLSKYVLRSKVTLGDRRGILHLYATDGAGLAAAGLPHPDRAGGCVETDAVTVLRWHEPGPGIAQRFLLISPVPPAAEAPMGELAWRLADLRAGLPQVFPETHEAFVAQMLNLDVLGGISFEKGCYTGQEIVARTQYRGAVKRRMFRFAAPCAPPTPGTRILHEGAHAGDVVDAVGTTTGCELLAVVNLAQRHETLLLGTTLGVGLMQLPLPYDV